MTQHFIDYSLAAGVELSKHYTESGRPRHGSPEDRGMADRYYGRVFDPHWEDHSSGKYRRVPAQEMSRAEIAGYTYGFNNETGQKDWGVAYDVVEGECEEHVND